MSFDWTPLHLALRDAAGEDALPRIWWRDDDATEPTPMLDHLMDLSDAVRVPVHLAIIPAMAVPSLRGVIDGRSIIPVVHGWAHQNHNPVDAKKAEFQALRPEAASEAGAGLVRLQHLIGPVAPMFVPPWNRIAPEVVQALASEGFRALSTFAPRTRATQAGLQIVNTHIDPIAWKAGRGLVSPDILIAQTAALITARLHGEADRDEPLGLLTHHLVQNGATWEFCDAFLQEMRQAGCGVWSYEERV